MLTLKLHKLHFYSYHGWYDGEELIGHDFEVSLDVTFNEEGTDVKHLHQTICYEDLFNIVNARMGVASKLLEEVAMDIGKEIHTKFPFIKFIRIDILKERASIKGLDGEVGVSWYKDY